MNTKIVKPILGQIMILMLLLTGSSAFAAEDVHKLVIQVSTDDVRTQNITESRMSVVEAQIDSSNGYMRENFREINSSLALINSKLDRVEERTIENRRND